MSSLAAAQKGMGLRKCCQYWKPHTDSSDNQESFKLHYKPLFDKWIDLIVSKVNGKLHICFGIAVYFRVS